VNYFLQEHLMLLPDPSQFMSDEQEFARSRQSEVPLQTQEPPEQTYLLAPGRPAFQSSAAAIALAGPMRSRWKGQPFIESGERVSCTTALNP
jgi:hypothetical protein